MKKLIRFIFKAILWLVLLLIIALVGIYIYAGHIVKESISRFVPPITGTSASVADVDLSLFSGRIGIKDLKIGNPKGFSDKSLFELGGIDITFDPKSVLTDKIIINSVLISGTKVSAELKNLHSLDSNIGTVQKNVEKYIGTSDKPAAKSSTQTKSQSSSGKKVIIRDLKIAKSELTLGVSGQTATIPLPDIQKKNIGADNKEKTIPQVIADILNMMTWESVQGTATAVSDLAKKGFAGAKDMAKQTINDAKDLTKSVSKNAKDAVGNIKGLFK